MEFAFGRKVTDLSQIPDMYVENCGRSVTLSWRVSYIKKTPDAIRRFAQSMTLGLNRKAMEFS